MLSTFLFYTHPCFSCILIVARGVFLLYAADKEVEIVNIQL